MWSHLTSRCLFGRLALSRDAILGKEKGHFFSSAGQLTTSVMCADLASSASVFTSKRWPSADLRLAQRSQLFFTAAHGELIRRGVAGLRQQ